MSKQITISKCHLVLIEWEDSRQPTGRWERIAGIESPGVCHCISVGFLLDDGDGAKVLAPNMADITNEENMQTTGVICIPKGCVKRIVRLEEKD